MTTRELKRIDTTGEYKIIANSIRRNLSACEASGQYDPETNSCSGNCSDCDNCTVIAYWTGMFRNEHVEDWKRRRGAI